MDTELALHDISALPPVAQKQVIDFIAFLRTRYAQPRAREKAKQTKLALADESFIGLWRDRQDMQDSSAWVRNVRQREWAGTHE